MKDLRTMARYLRPCRWDFFVAILLLLVECGFEMAIPLLMTGIIDDGVALGDVPRIWKLGAAMALCAGLALIAGFIYARFAARAAYRFGGTPSPPSAPAPACGRRSMRSSRASPSPTWTGSPPRPW